MLFRNCAGGIVFNGESVFILKNDKKEWILPKASINNSSFSGEIALEKVYEIAEIKANIIAPAGETSYEFYSYSRQEPVCNRIAWFLMYAETKDFKLNSEQGYLEGGFYPLHEALNKITYSQEKSLVNISYKKYYKEEKMPLEKVISLA